MNDPAGRRTTHERRHRRAAQRVRPFEGPDDALSDIWILPKFRGVRPGYEQKSIPEQQKRGRLRLVASPDGASDSVAINADARMYARLFDGPEEARMQADPQRKYYVHLVRGELGVNGQRLKGGDAAMLERESEVALSSGRDAEVLVFDLQP